MGELAKDFLTQFHNLPGDTVKGKQQNSFRLFHKYQAALNKSEEDLNYVTENLKPASHLEKIFRIDFLIYFRRFEGLYREFMSGDEITISKVAKQVWFFQRAFKDLGAAEFVNDMLPNLSYVLKLKILKRLPVDEKQGDQIFDAVHKRYGLYLATNLLTKCSVSKIREMVENNPVKFTVSQLKLIHSKEPNLIPLYVQQRTKLDGGKEFMNYNPFFVYLAQKNPDMFSKLFEEHEFNISLGNRTTKRYIDSQKDTILTKPEPFIAILNKSRFIRKLGYGLTDIFFKEDPGNPPELYWDSLLKYYPKKQRFTLYKTAFNSVYHHKFGEKLNTVNERVLKMILDISEREHWAKLKLKQEENEDYLQYVSSEYCMKVFTEKLSQMTASERSKFIDIATECCILNEDLDTLLKLCQLVAVRFKNDGSNIRSALFNALEHHNHIIEKLNEQHWKYIIDIYAVINAKSEWVYSSNKIRFFYLKFLVKNNQIIRDFVKFGNTDLIGYVEFYLKNYSTAKIYKSILSQMIEIGHPKPDSDYDAALYDSMLAEMCKNYNKIHPNNAIDIWQTPRIFKSVKYILENECPSDKYIDNNHWRGIEYVICRKTSSEEVHELKKLYFKCFKKAGGIRGVLWFLKHEPKTLEENFDNFLAHFYETRSMNTKRLWLSIKKYSYLDLDKRIVEFCITKLKEEGFKEKTQLVKALSMLAKPDLHLEFMKSYIPTSAKVDLLDDELKEFYLIQCEMLKFLHLVKSPALVLPFALQFCMGDYLKYALGPLYSSFCHLPENETKAFIEKIDKNKAVSVKKHAINISCVIYEQDTVYNMLKNATVPSLMPSLKYFVKNPSDPLWDLVEQKIITVEEKDVQTLKWTMPITVPYRYKGKYVEAVWTVLDKYDNHQIKKILLKKIKKDVIEKLDPKFAYSIIEKGIFKIDEVNDLVSNLLIYLDDPEKYDHLKKIIKHFKERYWYCQETKRTARFKFHQFIKSLFQTYMELKEVKRRFANDFATLFNSIFSPIETFEDFVLVSFMQVKDETPENCAKFFVEILNDLIKDYDKFIINPLTNVLKYDVFGFLFKTVSERIKFCYSLFKFGKSVDNYLQVVKFLPESTPHLAADFKLYNEILTELEQVADKCVQLQFNLYLKSESSGELTVAETSGIPTNWCGTRVPP